MKSVHILNCDFHALTLTQTVEEIFGLISRNERGWLCTVNVAILMMMREDERLQRFVRNAVITVADGQPLVWASAIQGKRLPERVAGVDLVHAICERAAREGIPIYLLGAKKEIVIEVSERLKRTYPGLVLAGVADGYFQCETQADRIKSIAQSDAKILITAMGVPKQEYFIEEQWQQLGVNIAIGVGGSFDVISGLRSRAPRWIQRIGMEWAYRLGQEPGRLFKRYLYTNTKFLLLITRELLFPLRIS